MTENERVRFFNIVKNKNVPFFGVCTTVNLKKVRFFVIFERKVVQMKIISIWQNSSLFLRFSFEQLFSHIFKKTHFFKFTLVYTQKKGAFLFFMILKKRTFLKPLYLSKILAIYTYFLLNYNHRSLWTRIYMVWLKYDWKWKGAFFQYREK